MRAFAILCGPASYTLDRNKAVFDKLGVKYAFQYSSSFSSTDHVMHTLPIKGMAMVKYLRRVLKENDVVMMSGYVGKVFLALFLLNIWYRKPIGIFSDTQLRIPQKLIPRIGKWLWLNIVFRNRKTYGLAGGNFSHKELFRHYGMAEERICLLPMMVNNDRYNIKEPLRNDDIFRFLYVGRLVECKNVELLIGAFNKAFALKERVLLHIVGDGALRRKLMIKAAGNKHIRFMGAMHGDDLVEAYSRCNTLVLPSKYEPWGLVVNEAMSAGMSVIVSDAVGAHFDLVDNRETGLVFRSCDLDDLVDKLRKMYDNRDIATKFGENAKALMHDYWNYNLYEQCLKDFFARCNK